MIKKISLGNITNGKFNSYSVRFNNDVSFGSRELIIYGIPNREDFYQPQNNSKKSRSRELIIYGIPNREDFYQPQNNSEEEEEEPVIKYGIPSSESVIVPRSKSKETPLYKYAIPESRVFVIPQYEKTNAVEDESLEEENNSSKSELNTPLEKPKPSYFKRLWFALLGKDC